MATFTFNADDALPGWTESGDATLVSDSGSINTEVYKLTESGTSVAGSISQTVAAATLSTGLYSVLIRVRFAGGSIGSGNLALSVGTPSSWSIDPADASGTTWTEQNTYTYNSNLYMYLGVWDYTGGQFDITIDGPTSDADTMYFDRLILTTDNVSSVRATQVMAQVAADMDPAVRATQIMAQVAADMDPAVRATQLMAQVAAEFIPKTRATQLMAQVAADMNPSVRATQMMAQVAADMNPSVRATQIMAQVCYEPYLLDYLPLVDNSSGSWSPSSGTTLYEAIDQDDVTYISSSLTPSSDTFETEHSGIYWPASGEELRIYTRYIKADSGGSATSGGDEIDLTFELISSGTVLETWTVSNVIEESGLIILYHTIGSQPVPLNSAMSVRVTANTVTAVPGSARRIDLSYLRICSVDGTRFANAAPSFSSAQSSSSASFARKSTATASPSFPAATSSSSGETTTPLFDASAAVALANLTASSSATYAFPIRTANSAVTLPALSMSASGSYNSGVFVASLFPALSPATASSSSEFDSPIFDASVAVTLQPLTMGALAGNSSGQFKFCCCGGTTGPVPPTCPTCDGQTTLPLSANVTISNVARGLDFGPFASTNSGNCSPENACDSFNGTHAITLSEFSPVQFPCKHFGTKTLDACEYGLAPDNLEISVLVDGTSGLVYVYLSWDLEGPSFFGQIFRSEAYFVATMSASSDWDCSLTASDFSGPFYSKGAEGFIRPCNFTNAKITSFSFGF